MWLLRVALINFYTIYAYKNLNRWSNPNWPLLLQSLSTDFDKGLQDLQALKSKYKDKIGWATALDQDILEYKNIQGTKYAKINQITHFPIFAIYNESSAVISRSLQSIFNSSYDLDKIIVFVSQEDRAGADFNQKVRSQISSLPWVKACHFAEKNLQKVYTDHTKLAEYYSKHLDKISLVKDKLNIIFTSHPDGLQGEIKGKASNEDWGARQVSLFCKSKKIDPDTCLITSLDADSAVGNHFFHKLSYKFCLTKNRLQTGFQPIPVYSNNFFDTQAVARLIATQTTLYQFSRSILDGELEFFANYSVPLKALQKVDFWVREVIAEDYMLFAKCFVYFKGEFKVVPSYGEFEGDAVYAEDYLDSFANQYKQLQRWSWGGIESFPYVFTRLFLRSEGSFIDLRKRLSLVILLFTNHFFWSSTPIIFSVIIGLPSLFGGQYFAGQPIALNLWIFTRYFAWISIFFIIVYGIITFQYVARKSLKNRKVNFLHYLMIIFQWMVSPFIYGFIGLPALDSQLRGIFGKYLGYWVTPKK